MPGASADAATHAALSEMPEGVRQRAFDRYQTLRPHLEQNAPLTCVAKEASLPLRMAQRWVSRYRRFTAQALCINLEFYNTDRGVNSTSSTAIATTS